MNLRGRHGGGSIEGKIDRMFHRNTLSLTRTLAFLITTSIGKGLTA
jgi:hypothetical protein